MSSHDFQRSASQDAGATAAAGATAPKPLPRPEPGAPRPYHFPAFERVTLENGLGVIVAPVRALPMVTVMLVSDAGASAEPAGSDGVANITARALLEGTRRRGPDVTELFERLGASIGAGADWDASTVAMTVLSPRLEEALGLFGEVLLEPAFPERELERLRAERISDILQLSAEPRGLANEMFSRVLYEPSSRYARPEDGSASTVRALGRAEVESFYRARYQPTVSTLIIAGDVSVEDGVKLARKVLGGWKGSASESALVEASPARTSRAVHIVPKADAPQSELRVGHIGLPRSHPDYFPVLVMNSVLGGLFSSRINLNLREVHGYTYGAFSGYAWRRGAGPFVVSTAVKSDVTAESAREILLEIERMRTDTISEDELSLATSYLGGVFPIRYETTDAIARALSAMVAYRLPADYFDSYRDKVRAVTRVDVLQAADRHLHPEELQLLVVGDPDVVRAPLEALELGPVELLPAELDGGELEAVEQEGGR
ncbi:MAG TPA: pitrilysin family protein [Gemmatimonadaceae bacterium]